MKPENTPPGAAAESWRWNSPLPYLFGGLAAMLGLIALALLILACSYRNRSMDNSQHDDVEKPVKPSLPPAEMEPKILVAMPGYDNPTYLAKPVSLSQFRQQEQV